MTVLVKRPFDQKPKKDGEYILLGDCIIEQCNFKNGEWNCNHPEIYTHYYEEIELPTEEEIKQIADCYIHKTAFKEGLNLILDKLK